MFRVSTLLAIVLLAASAFASDEAACTGELAEAAEKFRLEYQELEDLVKVSTIDNQIGIEPSTTFDLANHNCHNIPGQAYRIYTTGICEKVEEYRAVVRFDYQLLYRRAATIEEMFKLEFEEGTDGILQVEFELTEQGWRVKSQRERLWSGQEDEKDGHDKSKHQ